MAPAPALAKAVAQRARAEGAVVLTCSTWSNVIRFLPPLSISDELPAVGLGVIDAALAAL